MKCANDCGRLSSMRLCHSCWVWLQFVRASKRDLESYWAACRKTRGFGHKSGPVSCAALCPRGRS